MKETLTYLFELTVCSGVFYAVYVALLERRTPFRWCRFYLLAAVGLSLVIPLLRIPVWPGPTLTMAPYVPVDFGDAPVALVEEEEPADWWAVAFRMIYGAGILVVAIPTLRQLLTIRRIRRGAQLLRTDEYTLVRTPERIDACSFFRTIYIWQGTPDEELSVILLHEASHVRHHHSAERIVMEAMKALLWWNPFVWLAAGRLNEVEEFEADDDVLRSGCSVRFYMQLILKQLLGYSPDITNGLRNSRTKKRFIMMTTNNSHRHVLLRLAGVAPALIGLLCAFSFTTRAAEIVYPDTETSIVETTEQPEEAFLMAEVMPKFHGGDLNTFRQWVQMQVRMPEVALKQKLQGRVVATFTIEKDGTLDDIQILQTPDRVFSEEVIRVLKQSDKWTPGTQKGEAVRVKYTLPIEFRVAGMDAPAEQGAAPAASATTVEKLVVAAYPKEETPAEKSVTVHATVRMNNQPLAGAVVQEMGSTNGTVTDAEGHATIKTCAGRSLKILYPECATYYYTAGKDDTQEISISLALSTRTEHSADGSVAVSGHGTQPNPDKPIVIVDDKRFEGSLNDLDPDEIAAMSIYKANGENAIVITTKAGAAKKEAAIN